MYVRGIFGTRAVLIKFSKAGKILTPANRNCIQSLKGCAIKNAVVGKPDDAQIRSFLPPCHCID
jgi:hypothetical protein